MAVWAKRARQRQPDWEGIDLSNPLTAGIQYAYNGALPNGRYTSVAVSTVGTRTRTQYPKGLGVRAGSSGQYWSYPIAAPSSSQPWTVAAVIAPRAGITGASGSVAGWPICTVADHPTSPGAYDRGLYVTNTTLFWQGYIFDGSQRFAVSSVAAVTGRADTVIVTTDGVTLTCSVNGVDSSVAVSNCGFGGYSTALFGIGTSAGSAQSDFDALMAARLVAPWGAAQRSAFHQNPWQLFAPQRTARIYSFPTAGGGTTVAVPAGAITLTGFAPTVAFTAHQTIAVPKGALVLSAFAPTVSTSAAQTIAVPLASLTLTGFAPTVAATAHQTISVPAASLTLTAYAPTVYTTAVTSIAVPKGTLTLTGYAPTINYTTNATIGVPVGSLTLTGYAPTVIGGTSSVWTQVSAASGTWTPASLAPGTWTPQ